VDVPATAWARAEEIATRLAAIAQEVGALPGTMDTNRAEPSESSPAAFARTLLRERRMREAEFPREMLGEPVWDMLLDLFAAHEEGKRVSISSACIASGVPATTALRYIAAMEGAGLLAREASSTDKRTTHLELSCATRLKMTGLLLRMARARGLPTEELEAPDQDEPLKG
jgi:DNA-binding MarR family transcriptional regulator